MFKINVNGQDYQSDTDMILMEYLREVLHITSVKNGCSEGVCGTCNVLIDGKMAHSCKQMISDLDGKTIQTIEGLTERERNVFIYAFTISGAVQCGFCTPGMIICGKALINRIQNPSREDVKQALRTNICRCTGYVKIEDAILLAAKMLQEDTEIPNSMQYGEIGENIWHIDAPAKSSGIAMYVDDYKFEGMLYGKNVFSKYARAKVLSINTNRALKMPGVVAIYTAKDIPGERYIGHLVKDWPGMIDVGEETKCIGDTIAIVVAKTRAQAVNAAKEVYVEYEEYIPVCSPEEASMPDAHQIHGEGFIQSGKYRIPKNNLFDHEEIKRGDAAKALENSKYIAEGTFYLPPTEHAFMEPEAAISIPDKNGLIVISSGQGIYDELCQISDYLGVSPDKIRIQSATVGGAFGGKEDLSVQHQAALCAYLTKKPVEVWFSRQESINYHPKRHAMEIYIKIGCNEDGILQGIKARIIADAGAYASLSGPVLQRICTHIGGPYNYQNVDIEGDAYYTNNPPSGAFRGFGVTQSCATLECVINQLAEKIGLSGWEFRYRNAIRPGQVLPIGQIADNSTALIETLEAVKQDFEKYEDDPNYFVGIASAMKSNGLGMGIQDIGRCNLKITNGKVCIKSSAADMGQGIKTVLVQIVCETIELPIECVIIEEPDTRYTPNAGTSTASRQTVMTGEAARQAALQLKYDLNSGRTLIDLEGKEYIGEFGYPTDPIESNKPHPNYHISYGFATQLVVIDKTGKLVKVITAHDVGRVVNPISIEGQIEGGIAMGLGYALTEKFPLKKGIPQARLGTLGILRAPQIPPIKICLIEKNAHTDVAFGSKGVGEIAAVLSAPAVQNAYYKKDGVFRYNYPLIDTYYNKYRIIT